MKTHLRINTRLNALLASTCLLAGIACHSNNSANKTSPSTKDASAPSNSNTTADSDSAELIAANDVSLKSISYDAASHSITLSISYGGCAATKHVLELNDVCAESYPMQCSATLKRPKSFKASCKMMIQETVKLSLDPSFDTSHVSVTNGDRTMSVLVDRTGKVSNSEP